MPVRDQINVMTSNLFRCGERSTKFVQIVRDYLLGIGKLTESGVTIEMLPALRKHLTGE
jgi:hypothetical protein